MQLVLEETALAMCDINATGQGLTDAARGKGEFGSEISELIRLLKEQNDLLQRLQTFPNSSDESTPIEPADESSPHLSLLGEPVSMVWGPLGSFLLHHLHQDGPTRLSAMREKAFLEQARSAFSRIVSDMKALRPYRSRSRGYSLHPKAIEAFEKQLSSWPRMLTWDENLGLGRAFSEDSNVYVHGSLSDGSHVSLGSVWYVCLIEPTTNQQEAVLISRRTVRTASWSSEDPTLSPQVVAAIVLISESCGASFDSEFRVFLLHYLGEHEAPLQLRVLAGDNYDGGTLWMPFHIRCFDKVQNLNKKSDRPKAEISCRRDKAIDLGIRERRRSIALLCPFMRANTKPESTGNYIILRLLDDGWHDFRYDDNLVSSCGLQLCQPWTGITIFQCLIWAEIDWWVDSWRGVLETVDNLVAFEVKLFPASCVLRPVDLCARCAVSRKF